MAGEQTWLRSGRWTFVVLLAGCTGIVTAPGGGAPSPDGELTAAECRDVPLRPREAPIRRLTEGEYRRTIHDLFLGAVDAQALALPPTAQHGGFGNNAVAQNVSPETVVSLFRAAGTVGEQAAASASAWAPCALDSDGESCRDATIGWLGLRALRRPLTEAEQARYRAFLDAALVRANATQALAELIHVMLASPSFLYLAELGDGRNEHGDLILSDHELASRLSYFLWGTMPDDALFAAAADGTLRADAGIEAQVRRMLESPRREGGMREFFAEWAGLDRLDEVPMPESSDPSIRSDLRESTLRFMMEQLRHGSFAGMFSSPRVYVNQRVGSLIGVEADGDELTAVDLENRAGLLTQPGWLMARNAGDHHSPVYRGSFVLDRVLCSPTGGPPPEVGAFDPGAVVDRADVVTTRERFEVLHTAPSCAGCHERIDGIGFLLENYDRVGAYGTTENGAPIDASGQLLNGDVQGPLTGGVELGERLASSRTVQTCMTRHLMDYGLGRTGSREDGCQAHAIVEHFAQTGDLEDMVVAFALSPAFRTKPAE